MPDYYHAPALILTAFLLPAFGYLYLRFRDTRTLLWFLGFLFSLASMVLLYSIWPLGSYADRYSWETATGEMAMQAASAFFLAALSPLSFRLGRLRILYVIPYALPIIVCTVLYYGVFHRVLPAGAPFILFLTLGALSLATALCWAAARGSVPPWIGVSFTSALGCMVFWAWRTDGTGTALMAVERANLLMAAFLVIFVFRRFSPGVVLSVVGFTAWSLTALRIIDPVAITPATDLNLIHIIVMGKVVAAMGTILLALEDELKTNWCAQERERRARKELEAYSNLVLSRRKVEDFDRQGTEICQVVTGNSRFAQAALLLQSHGRYRVAGSAGLDEATAKALDDLGSRIPVGDFLTSAAQPPAVEQSQTVWLDLSPWLRPGDDLKQLRFTTVLAVPMRSRTTTEGALLLAGMRSTQDAFAGIANEPLRADDLLPIELLVGRLQATRSQTMMLEKLIDSEKFAGLGQLAGNVTQQLNNPLTVILGYASLLDETGTLSAQERKGVESILGEARRMRSTLESLLRIARPHGDDFAAVSVAQLLDDMEELHRTEFLHRSIEFRMNIAPGLPRVLCNAQQLRQAVLHCLQFAVEAVESWGTEPVKDKPKTIRLEATSEGSLVQILVAHSGPGFPNPERAFDPFTPAQPHGETAGVGLSLCATIMRNNNGRASAVNLEPSGAAILLELRAA